MNAKDKARWVKALRSGKYPQSNGMLHVTEGDALSNLRPAGYCCLGVLREVCPQFTQEENGAEYLEPRDGLSLDIQQTLGGMNDDGVPFEMIAGLIHYAL